MSLLVNEQVYSTGRLSCSSTMEVHSQGVGASANFPPSASSSSPSSSGRPSRGISIPCYAHPAVFRETNALKRILDALVLWHAMHPLCLSLYICPTSYISPPHCKLMFPNILSDPRYVIRQEGGDAALHDGLFLRHDIL